MKFKNSTSYSDLFLRHMVSWISKEIDLPIRAAKIITFKNAARVSSGHAWPWVGEIIVRLQTIEVTDVHSWMRHGVTRRYIDRIEILVAVTAHELAHLRQYVERGNKYNRHGSVEPEACRAGAFALDRFRERRDELITEWSKLSTRVVAKPKPTVAEKREANIRIKLGEWESKLQRAKNRVAHYRTKARYYDRKAANKGKGV